MSDLQAFDYGYQVGGTIAADSPVYVERSADSELLATLESGKFCYVFNSRQMGKSSLRVRTQAKLLDRGWACASIDLTNVISDGISESQFYNGLMAELTEALDLDFQRKAWLAAQDDLSPVQQFGNFVAQVVLGQISQPIAIFIDEIDSTLRLNFSIDPFFARIRSFYNQRSEQPAFQRLTFCLVGVAAPSQLIRDRTQTPFNIGEAIELSGLALAAALGPLGDRLPGTAAEREQTLREILDWTGGQPFLTQRLCALVRDNEGEPVATLVQREIVERWQFDDPQEHFKARRDRLLEANPANLGRRLGCYQRVLAGADGLELDSSEEELELRLVGLVRSQGGRLRVYNRIYGAVFDSAWVAARLAELRPYEEQLQAWLKSGEDKKYLLRGKALRSALQFRRGKRLTTEDENFLLASTTAEAEQRLRWAGIGSGVLIVVAMGATWFGAQQIEQAKAISQLEQNSRAIMNQFENNQLESLVQAYSTLRKLKKIEGGDRRLSELATTGPVDALANALAQIQEKNKLQGYGNSNSVNNFRWSPDGQTLATITDDGRVRLWDVVSGQVHFTLKGHNSLPFNIGFRFDGKTMSTSKWNLQLVHSMSWSPDGSTLATSGNDGAVKLWNVASRQVITTLKVPQRQVNREVNFGSRITITEKFYEGAVLSMSWSPNGKILATGGDDKMVKLWDLSSGRVVDIFKGHTGKVWDVRWSPDGKILATSSEDRSIKLWNVANGQLVATLKGHSGQVWSAIWSPNGQTLISCSEDRSIKLWNVDTGKAITISSNYEGGRMGIDWSPDGKTLAFISWDGIQLWSFNRKEVITTLKTNHGEIEGVSWSPDGKTLATGSRFTEHTNNSVVRLWNVTENQGITTLKSHNDAINSVSWSPDGKLLATASGSALNSHDNTVRLWDAANHQLITTLKGHRMAVNTLSWSPDGRILTTGSDDETIKLWDVAKHQLITTLKGHLGWVWSVSVSPDNKILATGSWDNTVRLWGIASGKEIITLQGHSDPVRSVSWSPDGKILATGSWDNTVKLWSMASKKEIITLQGHSNSVNSVSWSPDGKTLATGSSDTTMKLWNLTSGQVMATLQGHSGAVNSVSWSPDGKTLATGSSDQTVKLWNVASGQAIATLQGHSNAVTSVSWSPDGKTLATSSYDGTVRLWPMTIDGLLDKACAYLKPYLTNPDHPERNTPKLCDYLPSP